ncbi:MAG: penicillin-binding protein 2 [Actinobacteria bacterium ATB1]|nr:penicillin-binding protein 2 [Actinobacteria bacterium ATB1]
MARSGVEGFRAWRARIRPRTDEKDLSISRSRVAIVVVVVLGALVVVGARTVMLQGLDGAKYTEMASNQHVRRTVLPSGRGAILDRRGRTLALSHDAQSLFANPQEIDDPVGTTADLLTVLEGRVEPERLPESDTLVDRLSDESRQFVWVARKVPPDLAEEVRGLEIEGVYVTDEPERRYPSGPLAASVLGYVDIDNKGLAGLEASLDGLLRGEPGELISEKDPRGRAIPTGTWRLEPAEPGADVKLTIDTAIQYEAEAALDEALELYKAKSGVAAVMDPRTGDILAFANRPTFDPNDPGEYSASGRGAWGVGDVFEPGSTSKVVTLAAAIEEGVVTPDSPVNVPSRIEVWDRTFTDSESHGETTLTVEEVIARSSNVGTIQIAAALGATKLSTYLQRFGYGVKTGIELPAESRGITKEPERWDGPDVASIAIGHTVAVTPLQMLRVLGTIANGGVMVEPRLVESTIVNGEEHRTDRPEGTVVVSPSTAATVGGILTSVVSRGTAPEAAVPGYTVAGKTGTSRKLREDGRGYDSSRHVASFVGFAPVEDPRAVVLVVLDEPTPSYGGKTAAPTFSRIMSFTMRSLHVAPSPTPQEIGKPRSLPRNDNSVVRIKPPTPSLERRAAESDREDGDG